MELRTERLVLRDFVHDDWREMLWIEGDPETVRYQTYEARTEDECRAYIARDIASRGPERSCFDLAVTMSGIDGKMVGRIGLDVKLPERGVGELWFVLDRAMWGRGLMPEAARALVDFGFREQRLHRIFLECDPRNTGAKRLAEKVGMQCEGQLRQHLYAKGEWCDCLFFGVLRTPASRPA